MTTTAPTHSTFTSTVNLMHESMEMEYVFFSSLLWFVSLALMQSLLAYLSYDPPAGPERAVPAEHRGTLGSSPVPVRRPLECVSVVIVCILYSSLRFRQNYVWRIPPVLCALFAGVPVQTVAYWCVVLRIGDVGRTLPLLFPGFDSVCSGTILYALTRYAFVVRVSWAVFHEGPIEDGGR